MFRASSAGTLNLATAVPVSGSYHTADAAGLLWSLHTAFTTSPDTPFVASLTGFAAKLYTPATVKAGAPAVVVIGGYPGDEDIPVAQGLALSGYPALAVGYFNLPGLPKCQCATPLEYFARAVNWLRAQPAGRGRRVVLYGGSDGTQAALLTASYLPHLVDAVVASSPTDVVHGAFGSAGNDVGWTFGGKPLAVGSLIPVTKIRVPLLLGDGGQDPAWNSAGSASTIVSELDRSAGHPPVTNLYYPSAGHYYYGMLPYFPLFTNAGDGGTVQANALATEQFWTRMISFLNQVPAR